MTHVERENERMRKPKIKVTLKVTVHFESYGKIKVTEREHSIRFCVEVSSS